MAIERILLNHGRRRDEIFIDPESGDYKVDTTNHNIRGVELKGSDLIIYLKPKIRSKRG